ncbi:BTB/POZ and TAZ domain-containing protein 4 isoform X2 [Abrus precatorius]|uniref:BTB/POZ and TAZ domain-containing protein 4 isoform X2 n=1 Tax=Abrus precatorius TaxID=3816 RepID=A0A8B8LW23_ABRPR|nr:BTB/POZ and TAZ domain-containing protein 4 isoform X2 [Abrus precatorius]XP_027360480.1 BTB/POZ and TAZ domain-containing protein 4 isoform X2 [Abrus precatorius]XP_027360481.1 BTB/POZ and TAZ domain-containing protein 4 isoform X2 [Abrus precatorius]
MTNTEWNASNFDQEKHKVMANEKGNCCNSLRNTKKFTPAPPPMPHSAATGCPCECMAPNNSAPTWRSTNVSSTTKDMWERLFDQGYNADVCINTDNGGVVYAHSTILAMASPVLRGMLKQANRHRRWRTISILGVPHDAVRVFIRFLYSSSYEKEEMDEMVLQLMVLSHAYMVPHLKRECEQKLELDLLNIDNVVDVFQLALLCDAPRLSLICHRKMLKNFKAVSESEGWKAMKHSHPALEKEILESVIDEENSKKDRMRKIKERRIYMQLYEAMEALVHICRDGCRTIGPHDKDFKSNQPCKYEACKGLELLVRHFAGCKLRVPGGCVHCKRMWQLLELHSRLCADPDYCRVPLCRNFKQRISRQSKKDEIRWKILVEKILRTRGIGIASCFRLQ